MLKRILIPVILVILAWGFWISPDFKEIAAGVSIFLFGMLFLEEGFRAFTGGLLEKLLKKTTDTLWKSVLFGIVSTTIMQSSSLVSVITISFISTGLIWLSSGIGIIFGANIGTTTGAWLVAGLGLKVKISAYAMPMLVFGIVLVFQKSKSLKGIGYILAGLGFLFLGIHHMKEGFEAFKETIDLAEYAMPGFAGLIVFTLIGMFATVVMQSSHATLVLILTALAAGQITYENALALAIGANIGTTITAIIGSLSANFQGKRLAGAHLIFNVVTGMIAIIFIHQLVVVVDGIAARVGIAEDDFTLKLAVFHTVFNLIGVAVMTPLVGRLVDFLEKTIPTPTVDISRPRYLTEAALDFPETMLEAVRHETRHLYENAFEILAHGLNLHRHHICSNDDLEEIVAKDRKVMNFDLDQIYITRVKALYGAILDFLTQAETEMPAFFSERLHELRAACHGIVISVKDLSQIQENVDEYMVSDNATIRHQYNDLRLRLASVMRDLYLLGETPEEERDVLALDRHKTEFEEDDITADGTLDDLIRENRIDPEMATSLINDYGFVRRIIKHLVDADRAMYGPHGEEEREAQDTVSLTEEDIDDIRKTKKGKKKKKKKNNKKKRS